MEPFVDSCSVVELTVSSAIINCTILYPQPQFSQEIVSVVKTDYGQIADKLIKNTVNGTLIELGGLSSAREYEVTIVPRFIEAVGDPHTVMFTTKLALPVLFVDGVRYVNESMLNIAEGNVTVKNVDFFNELVFDLLLGSEKVNISITENIYWKAAGLIPGQQYNLTVYMRAGKQSATAFQLLEITPSSPKLLSQTHKVSRVFRQYFDKKKQ